MDNIFSENILWSIGTIIVLFGIIAAHRLGTFRDRKNAFTSASTELISAFAPAIARLDAAIVHVGTHDQPAVNQFFKDNFEIHSAAVEKFKKHIQGWHKLKKYEKEWEAYCDLEPYGGAITLFAGHYVHQNGKHFELIKTKIENILKFTE